MKVESRCITGLCFAVLFMAIQSWLNERSTNENRGRMFSIYAMINFTVIAVGQMMLTLADPRGFALFAGASILISLAALPVALTRAEAPAPLEAVGIRMRRLYRCSARAGCSSSRQPSTGCSRSSRRPACGCAHPCRSPTRNRSPRASRLPTPSRRSIPTTLNTRERSLAMVAKP